MLSQPTCLTVQTQQWGTIMKAKVAFSSPMAPLNAQNMNNILCFFAKAIDT